MSGASFLLCFLLFFHPLQQNISANRWLGFFVFIMGCAFVGSYLIISGTTKTNNFIFKCLCSLQFLLPASFYISILYFVHPNKTFRTLDWLHFLPFVMYATAELILNFGKESISIFPFFQINDKSSLFIRDILPFMALYYLIRSFTILSRHKKNLKLIASAIHQNSLGWLTQFLFILLIIVLFWLNDALFGLPYLTPATNYIYTGAVFFLAYFSIRQKAIFSFKEKDIKEISEMLEYEYAKTNEESTPEEGVAEQDTPTSSINTSSSEVVQDKPKFKRLNNEQIEKLSVKLSALMEGEKIFLDNDLGLPTVAEKLGISIHETSFLINEVTKDNFYNYINKYRVDEAKRLLASTAMEQLNILGIAYASGFNSKTTFNTTFKKIVGISPSQYSKESKNYVRLDKTEL